jgi:hypothetical protein
MSGCTAPERLEAIDLSLFQRYGFVHVGGLFAEAEIDRWAAATQAGLDNATSLAFRIKGERVTDFLSQPAFSELHGLPTDPRVHTVVKQLFGGGKHARERYRFTGENDATVDRISRWHKDWLTDEWQAYEKTPLWLDPVHTGGHVIVKTAIYLQDHTHDDSCLRVQPGTHRAPLLDSNPKQEAVLVLHP